MVAALNPRNLGAACCCTPMTFAQSSCSGLMMLRSIGNFYGSVLLKIITFGHPYGRALFNFGNLGQASARKLLSVCNLGRPEGKATLNPGSALLIVCNLREPYGSVLMNYDKRCGNPQQSVSEILQSWDTVWQRAYYFQQSTSENLLWQRAPDMSKSQGTLWQGSVQIWVSLRTLLMLRFWPWFKKNQCV